MKVLPYLALLSLLLGCSHSSTSARIRRLSAQERNLRTSIETLSSKQEALRAEIARAQEAAEAARCEAARESYRAVVANLVAEYHTRLAEHKGCKAKAAKGGGAVAAVGCGLATFLTGGLALALCGGALATGAIMSEGSCDREPSLTAEDIRLAAEQKTGHPREPSCSQGSLLASPYGLTSRGGLRKSEPIQPYTDAPALRKPTRREIRQYNRALRKAKRHAKAERRAQKKAQKKHARQHKKDLRKAKRKQRRSR